MLTTNNAQNTVPNQQVAGNALLISGELVDALMSAISRNANQMDRMPAKREVIDNVVTQMTKVLRNNPVYYVGPKAKDRLYKYFGSEVSAKISNIEQLTDKGRFVEACIIAYLYGETGMKKYCRPSRLIRPRVMSQQEVEVVAKTAAAIAEAKDVDSEFRPTTYQGEI